MGIGHLVSSKVVHSVLRLAGLRYESRLVRSMAKRAQACRDPHAARVIVVHDVSRWLNNEPVAAIVAFSCERSA